MISRVDRHRLGVDVVKVHDLLSGSELHTKLVDRFTGEPLERPERKVVELKDTAN